MLRISVLSRSVMRQLLLHHKAPNQLAGVPQITLPSFRFQSNNFPQEKVTRELIASQDSDTFGSLSPNVKPADDELIYEDDIKEEEFIKNKPTQSQKLSTKEYAEMIKNHLEFKRIKEAIDVLEVRMLKEDRVKPERYIFNLLIDGCAKVGFSAKAFGLFTKLRQRGLKADGSTYTSLFTACANAPWSQDGLIKANRLREIMLEKGFEPNAQNYNAMIKAYGRCNDLQTAFLIADEMRDKGFPVELGSMNFLLQACASDKEFGFRHALLVWHKIYKKGLTPDIFSFNLMLRCCRDSNFGDAESMEEVLRTLMLSDSEPVRNHLRIEAHGKSTITNSETRVEQTEKPTVDLTPNLLARRPHLGSLISLNEVTKTEDKFLLLGGLSGFLATMKECRVAPDLKTFTELIEVIPATTAAEKRLLSSLKKMQIKSDVDFFNILMKKRAMRFDYNGAREVLGMIDRVYLKPDIVTYGVLALSCQTHEEARALIEEMEAKDIKMNIQILGAMLKTGCIRKDFDYVLHILSLIKDLNLKPGERILECLNVFLKVCNKEKKREVKNVSREFRRDFNNFKMKLDNWKEAMGLKDMELDEAKKILKDAPWEQFQSTQAEGYEDPKGMKIRKMTKLKRHIQKIKEKDLSVE